MKSNLVATIIVNPKQLKLTEAIANEIITALEHSGAIVTSTEWLAKDLAFDIYFAVLALDEARRVIEHFLENMPIDYVVQPIERRRKKLLIADMDSTIITVECIDELADYIGEKERVAEITKRAMNGEIDFPTALRERVALLKDLDEEVLERTYQERVRFTPGAKELVATMKKNGAVCFLVSGGFTFFTSRVRDSLGFDEDKANILEIEKRRLTGKVIEPILGKEAKKESLIKFGIKYSIDLRDTLAIGDGANDLLMLNSAGLGVAYHAKPVVKVEARAKIDVCDLTSLLYVQGYKAEEICSI